jgi:glycosyltransferase involved in cell wall biosynthesis
MTWIDVTDIIDFLAAAPSVTGIQRAALDLTAAMCAASPDCRTCAYCKEDGVFKAVALEELLARMERPARTQDSVNRIKARILKTAVSLVPRRLRKKFEKAPKTGKKIPITFGADLRRGDTFVSLGAFWHDQNHVHRIQKAVFVNDMKFALMIYDLIPINHSYWFSPEVTSAWSEKIKNLLRLADYIFAISHFTANEVRKFAFDNGIPIGPITIVRLGDPAFTRTPSATGLDRAGGSPGPQYKGASFVLMVSSIDIRKNQTFLLPIWSRLVRELGREATPDLLLVGKNANRGNEFLALLNESPELDGKVVVLNEVRDNELAWYYRKALFTVFPSRAEGWGFPVAESLSFGKVCVSSDADSIREVGGDFVSYFAADDHNGAYKLIKSLIINPDERARLESVIATRYRPVEWATAAGVILTALSKAESAREK